MHSQKALLTLVFYFLYKNLLLTGTVAGTSCRHACSIPLLSFPILSLWQ